MSAKKYQVELSDKQRKKLKALSSRGKVSARKLNRARILLLADRNRPKGPMTDAQIHQILDVSLATIARIRQQFSTAGLAAAIDEKPRSGRPIKFSGHHRAKVTALACSTPPEGNSRWSLRLLADRLVELAFVESIAYTSAAFYQEFTASVAFELTERFQMHYTPTNGSWLNMAELELSAISRQCLNRRIGDKATLKREVEACVNQRNAKRIQVDWQFRVTDARDKFSRFYPNNSKHI